MKLHLVKFADVITLPSTRAALSLSKWTADPLAAGIERFVGLAVLLKAFEKIDRLYNRSRGVP